MPVRFNGYQFQNGSEDSPLQNAANSAQTSRRIREQSSWSVLDQHQRWQRGRWTAHIAIGGGGTLVVATDANSKVGRTQPTYVTCLIWQSNFPPKSLKTRRCKINGARHTTK